MVQEVKSMQNKICRECGKEFTLSDEQVNFYTEKGMNIPTRCEDCRRKKRMLEHMSCKDCGKVFTINGLEIEFYERQGLQLPKRCPECRKRRREEKNG
jgi:predicted RNA-binding Zn-ribbon protein involved in translation (DUF1610 family)